ncbi:MAG TPA: hypothetical protein VII87_08605, partial [Solirubrobacteraceae bacterium]
LGGVLQATHARPRLLIVAHPSRDEHEAFWIAGGRLVDSGPIGGLDHDQLLARTRGAVARGGRLGELGAHVPPEEIDEVRIIGSWLASHPQTPQLVLDDAPEVETLGAFRTRSGLERELHDDGADLVGADRNV